MNKLITDSEFAKKIVNKLQVASIKNGYDKDAYFLVLIGMSNIYKITKKDRYKLLHPVKIKKAANDRPN